MRKTLKYNCDLLELVRRYEQIIASKSDDWMISISRGPNIEGGCVGVEYKNAATVLKRHSI